MTGYSAFTIDRLEVLVDALLGGGWQVVAPRVRDGAVVIDRVGQSADIAKGVSDEQSPGHYRLKDGTPGLWFEHVVGPHSWKSQLFPARQHLWSAKRTKDGFIVETPANDMPKTAFIGVRACDLAAIGIHDKVFGQQGSTDPGYRQRRENSLIVAVQCARSADTCFCASMNTGPRADAGFDLALTELGSGGGNRIYVEVGSEAGAKLVDGLKAKRATKAQEKAAEAISVAAASMQSRHMPAGIDKMLKAAPDHERWDHVAERCLSCSNCTLACPTCFCTDVEDVNDLTGDHAERWRVWDSCFAKEFSYIHGGAIRRSTKARYRQWMTHKLSGWHDQFGSSGCVGCGRCITWCPAKIDIVEEASAMAVGRDGKGA